ncbi:MAG: ATP-binding protein [Gammaproteobacteria bacterium]|jgi:two-component system sensor histidine kinase RpfC
MLQSFFRRIKSSPGREHQQAFLRLIIGILVFTYISVNHLNDPEVLIKIGVEAALLLFASLSILTWIYISPKSHPLRYVTTTAVDACAISYAIYLAGEYGAALYPLYLWITFGYGFRFGSKYLTISALFSILGFTTVYFTSGYWHNHPALYGGLLVGLILLPIYVSTLINYLEKAIDEAKIANKAKSQFLANMSHELRTPLNGIIGSNDLLKSGPLTIEQQEYVETIDYSVNTLLGLIENILDISRIEAGRVDVVNEEFDLHNMLYQTTRMLTHHAAAKELMLKLHVEPEVPFALIGDDNHVRQVLVNLIGNAIKYTNEGYIQVRVSLVERKNDDCTIRFEVIDTGPGINKEDQKIIFERFTQADSSDTRKHTGTGLGTAIAKDLIEILGGSIGVVSNPGEGSNFWFELPFSIRHIDKQSDPHLNKACLIFLRDSDDDFSELLDVLEVWGVTVKEVTSAKDALNIINKAKAEGHAIHSILIAKPLIEFNPSQFVKQLQQTSILNSANLILLTDELDNETRKSLLSTGFDYILPHHVNKSMLFNAIHSSPLLISDHDNVEAFSSRKQTSYTNRYHILLAEDNEVNQRIISRMLEQGGHTVKVVNNGEEALNALDEEDFDLCIFDMQMPVMGGLQAIKVYRYTQPDSEIPFIILTANATKEAIEKCQAAKVNMYLTKPVRSSSLLSAVESMSPANPAVIKSENEANKSTEKTDSPVLDLNQLSFLSGDTEEINHLYNRFVSQSLKVIAQLESSVKGDYEEFLNISHMLKGFSGNLGATQLYEAACKANKISEAEYEKNAQHYVDEIIKQLSRATFAFWMFSQNNQSSGSAN